MNNIDPHQDIPARLRAARVEQGLELPALARELKNPLSVLESIERGEWSRLGAPVFARHLVGRYASRLGVVIDLDDVVRVLAAPELRSHVPASRIGRFADSSARNATYIGGTLLVVPLVFGLLSMTANGPTEVRALDPMPTTFVAAEPSAEILNPPPAILTPAPIVSVAGSAAETETATAPNVRVVPPPSTVAASLTGGMANAAAQLELRLRGDSWIEIFGRDGAPIERVLARNGDVRRFAVADVGRVTIGNVDATDLYINGSSVNLQDVRAANIARFTLSSDGSIEAIAR